MLKIERYQESSGEQNFLVKADEGQSFGTFTIGYLTLAEVHDCIDHYWRTKRHNEKKCSICKKVRKGHDRIHP